MSREIIKKKDTKTRHLLLMFLDASGNRINSKAELQKEFYFMSLLLNRDLGFKAHYCGPYSMEVEIALDELIGAGFVDANRYGFESRRYNFFLTESGKEFVEILKRENFEDYKIIVKFIGKLKEIGDSNYFSLLIAAKSYFILNKEGKLLTKDEIITKIDSFSWKVNEHDINVAVNMLSELGLVRER